MPSLNASRTYLGRKLAAAAIARASDLFSASSSNGRRRSNSGGSMPPSKRMKAAAAKTTKRKSPGSTGMMSGLTDRQANSRRVTKKLNAKGRKKVKVSKEFRAKVRAASEATKVRGKFIQNEQGILVTSGVNRQQVTETIPGASLSAGGQTTTGVNGLFSAARVLHVASRLWNGKTAVINPSIGGGGVNSLNLNEITTTVDVLSQYWEFKIRNNAPRTVYISAHKCMPKNLNSGNTPFGSWTNSINTGSGQGYIIGTPALTTNQLFTTPQMYKEFNQFFKVEQIDITIEPGQSYAFKVQGPAMTYDMKNFYIATNYQNFQKQDVFMLFRTWTDIVGDTVTSNMQRAPLDASTGEIGIESTYHCKVAMPETVGWQSGGIVPAAGAVQNVNRVERFCYDDFTSTVNFTAIDRTDEENPN